MPTTKQAKESRNAVHNDTPGSNQINSDGILSNASLWRSASALILVLVLAACGTAGNGGPGEPDPEPDPEPAAPLTYSEFQSFAADLNDELTTAIEAFTITEALQLAFQAGVSTWLPYVEPDSDGRQLLPRGAWELAPDEYGWWEWQLTRGPAHAGELLLEQDIELYDPVTDDWQMTPATLDIDWQNQGTDTTFLEMVGGTIEFPRNISADISSGGENIANATAEVDIVVGEYTCDYGSGSYQANYFGLNNALLNATVGSVSDLLLRAVDVRLDFDEVSGAVTSSGALNVEYSGNKLGLDWDASIEAGTGIWQDLNDFMAYCNYDDFEVPAADFDLAIGLDINDNRLDLAFNVSTSGGDAPVVANLQLDINGASALTIIGDLNLAAESQESLMAGLTVVFDDEEMSMADFIVAMEGIFNLGMPGSI